MRIWIAGAFMAGKLASAAPPPADPASHCGLVPEVIPDFSLVDENPASPTYGQTFTRDQFLGEVLIIYWAVAT